MTEYKGKVVKGVGWSLMERFGVQGMSFFLGIMMARLLTPEAYGLIGMILVFFDVAKVFVNSGFGNAYVQKKEVDDLDANTVFYTNLVTSIILYIVLYFAAPAISRFYDQPQLVELTRVMGIVLIINAFNIIQISQIKRQLNFKRKTQVTLISTLVSGAAGVTAAYLGLGVWSIVIQRMGHRFLVTSGLWLTSKWMPGLQFSRYSFQSMFSFGGWMLLSNVFREFFSNIYKLVIGKFFPAAQLGFYTRAKDFNRLTSRQWSKAISSVVFPAFSQMQDEKERLQNAMERVLKHTMVFIMPVMVTLMIVANPFVLILLTDKWAPMIPYLQLFCIVGILFPLHSTNIQVLMAQGKSRLNFNLSLVKNGLRILNILLMYRFGVFYIILGEVILSFIALLINTYYTKKLINYGFLEQVKDISGIILGAIIGGGITYGFISSFGNLWVQLFGGAGISFLIFVGFQYFFNNKLFKEVLLLKNVLSRR